MTSRYSHRTRVLTFDCNAPGCRVNFESEPGTFKDGWAAAQSEGWHYVTQYEGNISVARHFCPRHAASRGEAQ